MNAIKSEIERARDDLETALDDLEAAAHKLTPAHWRAVGADAFRRRPWAFLAGGFAVGLLLGRRRR